MPVERALSAYKKDRLNCSQSVLRAFQEHLNIHEDEIIKAKNHGHGRADDGVCGALFAAQRLMDDSEKRDRLRDAFAAVTGSDKCREIRKEARIPCVECVRLAASLILEHGALNKTDNASKGQSIDEKN